jgi:hypothetical protein
MPRRPSSSESPLDEPPVARALESVEELGPYPAALAASEAARRGTRLDIGLALSGGGIRSATFALGLAQGLARAELLSCVDIMSTVSGGGYFGAFYGHLLHRPPKRPRSSERAPADEVLADAKPDAVEFLRSNGRYLAPNGAGDLFAAGAVVLRNWVSALVVIGAVVLLVFTVLALVRYGIMDRVAVFGPALAGLPPWMSPYVLFMLGLVLLVTAPVGWTFWLVKDGPSDGAKHWFGRWIGLVAVLVVSAMIAWVPRFMPDASAPAGGYVRTAAQGAFVIALATLFWYRVIGNKGASDAATRRRQTQWLARSLVALLVLGGIALLDTVGIALQLVVGAKVSLAAAAAAIAAAVARSPLVALVSRLKDRKLGPLPASVAVLVALAVVLGYFGGIAAVPHLLARAYHDRGDLAVLLALAALALLLLIVVLATSHLWYFLNRSSMHALYEARLRRAYLGASNPARSGEGTSRIPITEPHPDDGLKRHAYDPSTKGGPIHLINVCVNETVDGESQLQQRDRKGMGMAVGPAGISVGVRHHALWTSDDGASMREQDITRRMREKHWKAASPTAERRTDGSAPPEPFRVFPMGTFRPEDLEIGAWTAISGAAVSTGLGSRTNPALSLLLGLFNVRLGYWWNSGVDVTARTGQTTRTRLQEALAWARTWLPMQMALLDEWLARFSGTARPDWYLTDGGHFENLGGYELIRRQLRVIVISDAEADADYTFGGLANLVRKARADFDTEITFLGEKELDALRSRVPELPAAVGTLEALQRGPLRTGRSQAHAAVARIAYRTGPPGWLIYVKPTLIGDEPTDVLEYHSAHPDFPHESTGDQFFDDAQWESYRRLGEHIAARLFGGRSPLAGTIRRTHGLGAATP